MKSTIPQERPQLLIADDEPGLVSALVRAARREGMSCVTDTTGSNVMKLARLHRPSVALIDIRQQVDGRDLLAALKRDPETRHIKVIMLSAVEDQFTRHLCFELGADDYETKPFDPRLMAKVRRMVQAALTEEAARSTPLSLSERLPVSAVG